MLILPAKRLVICCAALLAAVAACAQSASTGSGQAFPDKPIRMIVPLPPGTASDFLARTTGQRLADIYKQQVVIDNRAGAGGLIGSTITAKANPDGYTLAMIGPPHLVAPLFQDNPPYRPVEDFVAIAEAAAIPNVVVVGPAVPANSVAELIALAKAKPGEYNYPSLGYGTSAHLAAEIFNRAAGIRAVHVPFKGMADVYTEMLAGRVHYFVFTAPAAVTMLRDGKLKALAVTTMKRSPSFPDLPTVVELGMPAAESVAWFGIVAPAGTPRAIISRLHADFVKVLREPDIKEKFARQGAEPSVDTTPEKFAAFIKSEYARYQVLIREAGLKPQ